MTQQKIGPREQQLREMREKAAVNPSRKTVMGLNVGTSASAARPKWKKQLAATKGNAHKKDRRIP